LRRLVMESSIEEVGRYLGAESSIEQLESFEVISLLKEEPQEWAMICRVKTKDRKSGLEKVLQDTSAKVQPLEVQKDGSKIYFLRHRPSSLAASLFATGGTAISSARNQRQKDSSKFSRQCDRNETTFETPQQRRHSLSRSFQHGR